MSLLRTPISQTDVYCRKVVFECFHFTCSRCAHAAGEWVSEWGSGLTKREKMLVTEIIHRVIKSQKFLLLLVEGCWEGIFKRPQVKKTRSKRPADTAPWWGCTLHLWWDQVREGGGEGRGFIYRAEPASKNRAKMTWRFKPWSMCSQRDGWNKGIV